VRSVWRLCCWPDLTPPNPTQSAQPSHPHIHPAGLTPAHHESPDPMTTSLDKVLYTAVATSTGGRDGRSVSSDGLLDVKLAPPKELGGPGGATNPEQLFAAGYSACFIGAMKHVAGMQSWFCLPTHPSPPASASAPSPRGLASTPNWWSAFLAWTATRPRSWWTPRTRCAPTPTPHAATSTW
jgi:hypothetical protein